jgi:hypothetical protein
MILLPDLTASGQVRDLHEAMSRQPRSGQGHGTRITKVGLKTRRRLGNLAANETDWPKTA